MRKKKKRRCDYKITTKEARLLAYLRESRQLSMRQAASLVGVSPATINHIENGRRDLNQKIILSLLDVYGYSYKKFEGMLKGDYEIPEHLRSECQEIVQRLDYQKLRIAKHFLETL